MRARAAKRESLRARRANGTSIVHGSHASRPGMAFPAIYSRLANAEVVKRILFAKPTKENNPWKR